MGCIELKLARPSPYDHLLSTKPKLTDRPIIQSTQVRATWALFLAHHAAQLSQALIPSSAQFLNRNYSLNCLLIPFAEHDWDYIPPAELEMLKSAEPITLLHPSDLFGA